MDRNSTTDATTAQEAATSPVANSSDTTTTSRTTASTTSTSATPVTIPTTTTSAGTPTVSSSNNKAAAKSNKSSNKKKSKSKMKEAPDKKGYQSPSPVDALSNGSAKKSSPPPGANASPSSSSAVAANAAPEDGDANNTKNAEKMKKPGRKKKSSTGGGGGGGGTNLPSYLQMVTEAIVALKDPVHKGSSTIAISKWIQAQYPATIGPYLKTRLSQAFQTGVNKGLLTKLKGSYKISSQHKEKQRRQRAAEAKRKKTAAAAASAAAKKAKIEKSKKSSSGSGATSSTATDKNVKISLKELVQQNAKKLEQMKSSEAASEEEIAKAQRNMAKRERALRKKEEAERYAKERADLLRKRRYPMEDTKLHAEDEQWNINPPVNLPARPMLPLVWHLTCPNQRKLSQAHMNASRVDHLDFGSQGLVPDLLQVYHFWRGDVQFCGLGTNGDDPQLQLVPEFTLQHLLHATNEILLGHCKKTLVLPPLITHLFCASLSVLLNTNVDQPDFTPTRRKLFRELHQYLNGVLSPATWPDVCSLYMDAMHRFYTTDASCDPNTTVVPALNTDIHYLLGWTEAPIVPMTPAKPKKNNSSSEGHSISVTTAADDPSMSSRPLPDFYSAYLGNPHGALSRAHFKLCKSDPWMLSAEEIMALLCALINDIMAHHDYVGENIAQRDENMQLLSKNKRLADTNFRKARLAFEGPKKPAVVKKCDDAAKDEKEANGKSSANDNNDETKVEPATFKPTISKKQYETAKRAQQKANDAYEKGIRSLVARTQPVGYDRNFNAYYCFRHDPEVLYVEEVRPPSTAATHLPEAVQFKRSSWHVIPSTSLFDSLVQSLDVRGKREYDLKDELVGSSNSSSLRRYLDDDVKRQADAAAVRKEKEALKKKLEQARLKCDEEAGRRSGRLTGQAEEELCRVEEEIKAIDQKMANQSVEAPHDPDVLTGLEILRHFDSVGRRETRRSREKKEAAKTRASFQCSKLVQTGNIDGTGIIGMVVSDLLELEELCEALVPWEGVDRSAWISRLESAVHAWNSICQPIEPKTSLMNGNHATRDSLESTSSAQKRRRIDSPMASPPATTSLSQSSVLTMLKQPILQLEERLADVTNLQVTNRDQEIADDNMSVDSSGEDEARRERLERQWKKIIHRIRCTSTRRHVQIREMLVEALAAARKAHLPDVVAELRAALLQYHPNSATDCKAAAIKVLEAHGDYVEDEDDMENDNNDDEDDLVEQTEADQQLPSLIAAEAVVIAESFGGSNEDASRSDWVRALNSSKTVARLASLTTGFIKVATDKLVKLQEEHEDLMEALAKWEKDAERQAKKSGRSFKPYEGPSEVWTNVNVTNEICMAKTEMFPWWPAKKCVAKDATIAERLSNVDRSLVSLIGELGGLRVVKNELLQPFTGAAIDDDTPSDVSKEIRTQLDDCLAMARRIQRGLKKKK